MELRLLGRFDVVVDGVALPLGGPRQRAVLVVLAVRANEIVSVDRLMDDVWGGRPPATALATLRRYISHLRQALDGLPAAIVTRRPGYVLDIAPDVIDARRFERLVDEGRRHLASGGVEQAAAALRAALDLWQGDGEPLADFASEPFACIESTRLQELRRTAVELRIDADLALGRHRDLVPELEALVAAHPLHESYRGQLMRALHGSGRRADALRVYTEGRRVLGEELGLDPSTGLQQLEQAILLRDPDVEPPASPAPRNLQPGCHLPAEVTTFVGRVDEVHEVAELVGRWRLVTLTGVGGSGKSRLALRVAATLAPPLPNGAWLVELGSVTDAALLPRVLAGALAIREEPDRDVLEGLLETLRDQEALVVIDGCEHLVEAVARLVEALVAGTSKLRVLVTSRETLDIPGEVTFRVPTLAIPAPDSVLTLDEVAAFDAVRLFLERAASADADFRPTEEDAPTIAEVCRRLDGLPLALELAAARTDVLTLRQLADRLDDRFELLTSGHRTAPPRQRTLRATIEWSYDLLDDDERLLFDRLSVFAGSFTVETAEAVCSGDGLDTADVFHRLTRLVRQSLVVRVPTTGATARYRLLDTLREFGLEALRRRGGELSTRRRHAAVFTEMMERAAPALRGPGAVRALDDLEAAHVEFRAALAWLLEQGDGEASCRLAAALVPFWDLRLHVRDGRMWLERALDTARAVGVPPSGARLWATIGLASFAMRLDDFPAAAVRCDEALRLVETVPDELAEAQALTIRAEVARFDDELDVAERLCLQAAEIGRRCGDPWTEGDVQRQLTLVRSDLGDIDGAATAAAECLRLFRAAGDTEKTAGAQMLVAALALDRGQLANAAELFGETLGRFQQLGEPLGIGVSLWNLSTTSAMQGDYAAAARFAEESLRIYEQHDVRRGIALARLLLADAALGRGDPEQAEAWCDAALADLRSRGFAGDTIRGLATATRIRLARGDADAAATPCQEALGFARERGYTRETGRLLCLLAEVRLRQGNLADAAASACEALAMFDGSSDGRSTAKVHMTLADIAVAEGRSEVALDHLAEAESALVRVDAALSRSEADELERIRRAAVAGPDAVPWGGHEHFIP